MTKEKFENKIEELLKKCNGSIERDGYKTIFTFNYSTVVVLIDCNGDKDDIVLINCTKIEYSTHSNEILMHRDDVYIGICPISVIEEMLLRL